MNTLAPEYLERIAELHRTLGIPADYAARRGLALQSEADEATLVIIRHDSDGSTVRLIPPAADAWWRMDAAARAAGVEITPLSGFRSVSRQTALIRENLSAGRPLGDLLTSIAAPGFSEHHTGRALDLGVPGEPALESDFALTAAYAWLCAHAGAHGFHLSYPAGNAHGIVFEPWHWCWRDGHPG